MLSESSKLFKIPAFGEQYALLYCPKALVFFLLVEPDLIRVHTFKHNWLA